jgi:hypothetical protein
MVEPTFLVFLAVAFLLGLVLILRSTPAPDNDKKKDKEKKPRGTPKKAPNKGPQKNSLKKDKRPVEVKEWTGVDSPARDAQEMLEFLKGKDPVELAKQHNQGKPGKKKQQQQAKKPKAEDSASEDSASDIAAEDGFLVISKKTVEKKKKQKKDDKKTEDKEGSKASKKKKPFFKPAPLAEGEAPPEEEKKPKRERKPFGDKVSSEGESRRERPEGERKERPEGERKERPEGERRERPEGEKRERRERPDGERRPQRKPLPTVAPNVKYEEADLTDILDSITQDYKPKLQVNRISTIFSKIPRKIVLSILSKLEVYDLVALSSVNHYFSGVARNESLWRDIVLRDFGIRETGKFRNFRAAYKAEYKKRKAAKKQKKDSAPPTDDPKDVENAAVAPKAPKQKEKKAEDSEEPIKTDE